MPDGFRMSFRYSRIPPCSISARNFRVNGDNSGFGILRFTRNRMRRVNDLNACRISSSWGTGSNRRYDRKPMSTAARSSIWCKTVRHAVELISALLYSTATRCRDMKNSRWLIAAWGGCVSEIASTISVSVTVGPICSTTERAIVTPKTVVLSGPARRENSRALHLNRDLADPLVTSNSSTVARSSTFPTSSSVLMAGPS